MKKTFLRNVFNFLAISVLLFACKKEAIKDGGISAQSGEAAELRASTQNSINESAKSIAAFQRDFNNELSKAGTSKNSLAGLNIYQLTQLPVFNSLNAAIG